MFSILFIFSPRFDLLKQIEDCRWDGKMKEKPFHANWCRCCCYCCRCKSFCCISDNVNSDWLIDFSICTRARPYHLLLHSIKWLWALGVCVRGCGVPATRQNEIAHLQMADASKETLRMKCRKINFECLTCETCTLIRCCQYGPRPSHNRMQNEWRNETYRPERFIEPTRMTWRYAHLQNFAVK